MNSFSGRIWQREPRAVMVSHGHWIACHILALDVGRHADTVVQPRPGTKPHAAGMYAACICEYQALCASSIHSSTEPTTQEIINCSRLFLEGHMLPLPKPVQLPTCVFSLNLHGSPPLPPGNEVQSVKQPEHPGRQRAAAFVQTPTCR